MAELRGEPIAEVTGRCVRRGSYRAVQELEKAWIDYLDRPNKDPKAFVWAAGTELIPGKIACLGKRISNPGH